MSPSLAIFKALADDTRLRLLRVLEVASFNVGELCEILGMGQSRVSRHLKILAEAGLLRSRREGTWVYYARSLGDGSPAMGPELLRLLAEQADPYPTDRTSALELLDLRSRRSRQYFEEVAPRWDSVKRRFLGEADYLPEFEEALPACPVLVDLGSGTGDLLLGRAERHERLIGVDRSARMISEAERRRDAAKARNVEFRLGALEHLPLRDGEAQAAVANMVLHYVADPGAVLGEVHRALDPGGTLHIADLHAHSNEWMRDELNHQWLGFEPAELGDWLTQAGFEDVRTETRAGPDGEPSVLLASGTRR